MNFVNRICPKCNNPNYVVSLGNFSNAFPYKCMNCNSYLLEEDFWPVQKDDNNGWISVKDRLPTESYGTVLICYPNQEPYSQMEPYINARHDRRVATGHYSQHSHTWYHGDFNAVGGADPIACMPLPEPTKEE